MLRILTILAAVAALVGPAFGSSTSSSSPTTPSVCAGEGTIQGAADYYARCFLGTSTGVVPYQWDPAHVELVPQQPQEPLRKRAADNDNK